MAVPPGLPERPAGPVPHARPDHPRGPPLKPHFLQPLARRGAPPFVLRNERTGLVVSSTLEPAFDSASRKRGLLGRDGLDPGHALIIAPSNMVHTFFMRFPIDILFVDRAGRVVKARHRVPARRITGALRAFAVIEMAAGALDASGTKAGDRLMLEGPVTATAPEVTAGP